MYNIMLSPTLRTWTMALSLSVFQSQEQPMALSFKRKILKKAVKLSKTSRGSS